MINKHPINKSSLFPHQRRRRRREAGAPTAASAAAAGPAASPPPPVTTASSGLHILLNDVIGVSNHLAETILSLTLSLTLPITEPYPGDSRVTRASAHAVPTHARGSGVTRHAQTPA